MTNKIRSAKEIQTTLYNFRKAYMRVKRQTKLSSDCEKNIKLLVELQMLIDTLEWVLGVENIVGKFNDKEAA